MRSISTFSRRLLDAELAKIVDPLTVEEKRNMLETLRRWDDQLTAYLAIERVLDHKKELRKGAGK